MPAKYELVYETISDQIEAGILKAGDKLPDENTLAAKFGVSLITIRRAMTDLADAGLIRRVRGKGSYVNPPKADTLPREKVIAFMLNHGNSTAVHITRIVSGVHDVLAAHGYGLMVQWDTADATLTQESVNRMLANRVEGFIIYPYDPLKDTPRYDYLKSIGVPYVLLDRYDFRRHDPYVGSNDFMGGRLAARQFLEYGHTATGCVMNLDFLSSEQERVSGFLQEMRTAAVVPEPLILKSSKISELIPVIKEKGITALFCVSDRIATVTTKALIAGGMDVPGDISIIGFDDCQYDYDLNLPLSSVRQDFTGIGKTAAEKLLRFISNPEAEGQTHTLLDVEMIVRTSSLKMLK